MPRKKTKKNSESDNSEKKNIKERFNDILDMPGEIILNVPRLVFIGNKSLSIENYKGIIEYSDEIIRVNTKSNMIKITGANLDIKLITDEEITISGIIKSLEFIN